MAQLNTTVGDSSLTSPNPVNRTRSDKIFQIFLVVFFVILSMVFLVPVLNVVALSFSGTSAILRNDVTVLPVDFTTIGYSQVFQNDKMMTGFRNSFLVILFNLPLALLMTSLAAYPLAFGNFKGKKLYSFMILFTMWFSAGLIPNFMVIRSLGMLDSLWSLIVPSALGAYNIIILRNFMESTPLSIVESAKIDGANDFRILFNIIIPTSTPVLATISLWVIVARWNEFFNPLMYITDPSKYTLQVILRDIVLASEISEFNLTAAEGTLSIPEQLRNAAIVISMVPMLIIYPFLQRFFVSGIMLGSVKE